MKRYIELGRRHDVSKESFGPFMVPSGWLYVLPLYASLFALILSLVATIVSIWKLG